MRSFLPVVFMYQSVPQNHSSNLHAPLCGIFHPNSVVAARNFLVYKKPYRAGFFLRFFPDSRKKGGSTMYNVKKVNEDLYWIGASDR